MADQRDQGLLVGIDVGGTRIKAVLVSADDPALAPAGPPPGPGHADPVAAEQSGHGIPQIREPHPLASAVRPTPHPAADTLAEAVARELHTMKGEARMLGLAAIGQLAHCCEDLLKAEREKRVDARSAGMAVSGHAGAHLFDLFLRQQRRFADGAHREGRRLDRAGHGVA